MAKTNDKAKVINVSLPQLTLLKNALKEFSKYLLNASDDFAFEKGILVEIDGEIVLQFDATDIEGNLHQLQILGLPNTVKYATVGRRDGVKKDWVSVGLRGDLAAILPHFNAIIQGLNKTGVEVDRLDWDVLVAYKGKFNSLLLSKVDGKTLLQFDSEVYYGDKL